MDSAKPKARETVDEIRYERKSLSKLSGASRDGDTARDDLDHSDTRARTHSSVSIRVGIAMSSFFKARETTVQAANSGPASLRELLWFRWASSALLSWVACSDSGDLSHSE